MPTLVGFGAFAALPQEQISKKISRRILSGDQGMILASQRQKLSGRRGKKAPVVGCRGLVRFFALR